MDALAAYHAVLATHAGTPGEAGMSCRADHDAE
jgi:hypothetical protein